MKNSVVMVTGGAGFVGSHLVETLLANNNEVYVFDVVPIEKANNLKEVRNHEKLHYFVGDLRKQEDIQAFWQEDATAIYHLASVVGINHYIDDPLKLVDIVVIGTRHILAEAAKSNTKVIFTSTSEVYGKNPEVPWAEDGDRVLGPTYVDRWSYSTGKAVCEHMLYGMYKQSGLPFVIVRFFNVYGPRQSPNFVVSQSINKVLRDEQPLLYDDGKMTRCFTYVDDIVKGLILAAVTEEAVGEAINLGNSVEVTVKDVIETVLSTAQSDIGYKQFITSEEYGKQYEDIIRRIPKVDKAEEILGWKSEIQLEEGISKTIGWAKANPWWVGKSLDEVAEVK
ncbi:SDR family NAD(P)-dependent oxidoreductase [Ureibacillus chungkukjangi]|uniref:NAD-dependent epimerase/dehydratase family protein n=1 Tax=Ureibacillus chungkukjangi TaxID=1202712 RepID=UPI00384C3167